MDYYKIFNPDSNSDNNYEKSNYKDNKYSVYSIETFFNVYPDFNSKEYKIFNEIRDQELYKLSLIRIVVKTEEDKTKLTCIHCKKIYSRLDSLNRHKLICKKANNELDSLNTVITNEYEYNNKNVFIEYNNFNLKSFDEDWSIEHIDHYLKLFILLSQTKYTDFLKEVMKNKENLNIILEKNSDSCLIYKNKTEGYVKIKINELFERLMVKINEQLQKIFNEYLSVFIKFCCNLLICAIYYYFVIKNFWTSDSNNFILSVLNLLIKYL
jgi:hypothetical protein